MPDISMCLNHECPRNDTCYRYIAEPDPHRQSYMGFDNEDCEHYWPVEEEDDD